MTHRVILTVAAVLLLASFWPTAHSAETEQALKSEIETLKIDLASFQDTIEQSQNQLRTIHECEDTHGKYSRFCDKERDRLERILVPTCDGEE